ncbi:MAG: 16S rRNA (guanine(527)-N(7))-methyltransferase RsmG [Caulobacterales bacterium]
MSAAPTLLEPVRGAPDFAKADSAKADFAKADSAKADFGQADFTLATGADAAQMAALERLRAMLADWNGRMNLVGPATLVDFWGRHAWDSAQLLKIQPAARVWADIGAGGGFPGLILAILLKGQAGAHVHLIESQAKRCRFLQAVVEALGLPASVHNARAEEMALSVEIVTARAVAPLARLLELARPFLDRGARGLFLKGQGATAEIAEARKLWRFEVKEIPSLSDPQGRILQVTGLARGR